MRGKLIDKIESMLRMSAWERKNHPFVWTTFQGRAYRLLGINQNSNGIFVNCREHHQSFHATGLCHTRPNSPSAEKLPEMEFRLPRLERIETHLFGSHWLSINPLARESYGQEIERPVEDSNAVFVDPEEFGPYEQPVIEIAMYQADCRKRWEHSIQLGQGSRPHMELLRWNEYDLSHYGKTLALFLYRACFRPTADGLEPYPIPVGETDLMHGDSF